MPGCRWRPLLLVAAGAAMAPLARAEGDVPRELAWYYGGDLGRPLAHCSGRAPEAAANLPLPLHVIAADETAQELWALGSWVRCYDGQAAADPARCGAASVGAQLMVSSSVNATGDPGGGAALTQWDCLGELALLGRVHATAVVIRRYTAPSVDGELQFPLNTQGAPACSAVCVVGGAYVLPDGALAPSREVWCSDDRVNWTAMPSLPAPLLGATLVTLSDQDLFVLVGGVAGVGADAPALDASAGDFLVAGFASSTDCFPAMWTRRRAGAPVAGRMYPLALWLEGEGRLLLGGGQLPPGGGGNVNSSAPPPAPLVDAAAHESTLFASISVELALAELGYWGGWLDAGLSPWEAVTLSANLSAPLRVAGLGSNLLGEVTPLLGAPQGRRAAAAARAGSQLDNPESWPAGGDGAGPHRAAASAAPAVTEGTSGGGFSSPPAALAGAHVLAADGARNSSSSGDGDAAGVTVPLSKANSTGGGGEESGGGPPMKTNGEGPPPVVLLLLGENRVLMSNPVSFTDVLARGLKSAPGAGGGAGAASPTPELLAQEVMEEAEEAIRRAAPLELDVGGVNRSCGAVLFVGEEQSHHGLCRAGSRCGGPPAHGSLRRRAQRLLARYHLCGGGRSKGALGAHVRQVRAVPRPARMLRLPGSSDRHAPVAAGLARRRLPTGDSATRTDEPPSLDSGELGHFSFEASLAMQPLQSIEFTGASARPWSPALGSVVNEALSAPYAPAGLMAQAQLRSAEFPHVLAVSESDGSLWRGSFVGCDLPVCAADSFARLCATSPFDSVCLGCKTCPVGFFESSPCHPYADRACSRCTRCVGEYVTDAPCSPRRDTVCRMRADVTDGPGIIWADDDDAAVPSERAAQSAAGALVVPRSVAIGVVAAAAAGLLVVVLLVAAASRAGGAPTPPPPPTGSDARAPLSLVVGTLPALALAALSLAAHAVLAALLMTNPLGSTALASVGAGIAALMLAAAGGHALALRPACCQAAASGVSLRSLLAALPAPMRPVVVALGAWRPAALLPLEPAARWLAGDVAAVAPPSAASSRWGGAGLLLPLESSPLWWPLQLAATSGLAQDALLAALTCTAVALVEAASGRPPSLPPSAPAPAASALLWLALPAVCLLLDVAHALLGLRAAMRVSPLAACAALNTPLPGKVLVQLPTSWPPQARSSAAAARLARWAPGAGSGSPASAGGSLAAAQHATAALQPAAAAAAAAGLLVAVGNPLLVQAGGGVSVGNSLVPPADDASPRRLQQHQLQQGAGGAPRPPAAGTGSEPPSSRAAGAVATVDGAAAPMPRVRLAAAGAPSTATAGRPIMGDSFQVVNPRTGAPPPAAAAAAAAAERYALRIAQQPGDVATSAAAAPSLAAVSPQDGGHAAGAAGDEPRLAVQRAIRQLAVEAASPEARRLASHVAFFTARPQLLPSALGACQAPTLPPEWLRILAVLDEVADASSSWEDDGGDGAAGDEADVAQEPQ